MADEQTPEPEETEKAERAGAPEAERTAAEPEAKRPKRKPKATSKPTREQPTETAETPDAPTIAETPDAPATAPARRRRESPDGGTSPPVVRAQARYVRSSARKARLVCDHIRGKSVTDARAVLAHTNRAVARDWSKLLESAVANAENNHELVGEELRIATVKADEGPTLKRFRPRAMGRATRIRKRTSHLTILLTPKE